MTLLTAFCGPVQLNAQDAREISGIVTDSLSRTPLPGVSILLKDSGKGTSTDAEGHYSITAAPGDVLVFSLLGYRSQEMVTGEYWARIYAMPFYKTYVPNKPDQAGQPYESNGDWYIFRLAGTYLLRAEAYFWLGRQAEAAADINAVRARAKAPLIAAGDVTIDFIFDERARELFAETPRQNELNRVSYILAARQEQGYSLGNLHERNWFYDRVYNLNTFYQRSGEINILGQSPRIMPFHYQWPIDANIINSNTLGRINQNKGYVGAEENQPPLETIE